MKKSNKKISLAIITILLFVGSVFSQCNLNVNAGADQTIVNYGQSVTYNAVAYGGTLPYTYLWSNGAGNTASVTVSLFVTTMYSVTVSDAIGCTAMDQITVLCNPACNLTVNAGLDQSISTGQSVTLTATVSGGTPPYNYLWSNAAGGQQIQIVQPISTGTYVVSVTDVNGCTATDQVTITVIPTCNLTVSAGYDQTTYPGQTATLSATVSGGTIPFTYLWSNGAGNTVSVTVNPITTTNYTVTVFDINGCTATDQVTVTVCTCCSLIINAGLDQAINLGQSATLTAIASYGAVPYNYLWSNGAGNTASVTVSPTVTTIYDVTVIDVAGCTATNQVIVTVVPCTTPIVTVSPAAQSICSGSSLNMMLSSNVSGTTYSWTVVQNGVTGATSGSGNLSQVLYYVSPPGTATYTITPVANGCVGTPVNAVITVYQLPVVTPNPSSQTINSGTSTNIALTSNVTQSTFSWTVVQNGVTGATSGTGNIISQVLTNIGNTSGSATYAINSSANGCSASSPTIVVVTVNPMSSFSISGVVTYNNTNNVPLSGVVVNLMNGATQVASTTSNANGLYNFSNLSDGTYSIIATTTKPWGGVTATDVLKIRRHIVGLELLTEPVRISSSDVNSSGFITSTDVLKIQRRIVGLDNSFIRPDWNFEKPSTGGNSIIINGANITQNIFGLCTGDVNGSNNPVVFSKHSSISLNCNSVFKAKQGEIVDVSVNVTKSTVLGALQLFLKYSDNLVEVSNVKINSREDLLYTAENGVLRIIWSSLESLNLSENDVVLNLQLKVKGSSGNVSFQLLSDCEANRVGLCEFADATGNPINDLDLNISSIEIATLTSIAENSLLNSINIYPNPSQNIVFIDLGKNSIKDVTAKVFNTLGKEIHSIIKPESNNRLKLNFSGLANGLFIIQINTHDGKIVKTVSVGN